METMAEVEDVTGPAGRALEHVARLIHRDLRSREERERIEVALDRAVPADSLPRLVEWDAPVDRDRVSPRFRHRLEQRRIAAEVMDHGHTRAAHALDQPSAPRQ